MAPAIPALGMIVASLRDAYSDRPGVLCHSVYNVTHSQYLASGAEVFLATPLRILLVLVLAFLVRALLRRSIDSAAPTTTSGRRCTGAARPGAGCSARSTTPPC